MAKDRVIKCPGRFSELREFLHNYVVPLVLEEGTSITINSLEEMWDLAKDEVFSFDAKDPYYASKVDKARKQPKPGPLSLAPLFPSTYHFDKEVAHEYAIENGNKKELSDILTKMSEQSGRFFHSQLGRDPAKVILDNGITLAGYIVSANTGIGTASSGGVSRGGLRSDSPYLFEVYKINSTSHEQDLAALIGFWAEDNNMIVSQIQSCGNAKLPKDIPFGIATLRIAETAARLMNFDSITTYSARAHPIFKEHPNDWSQLGPDFVCMYDISARKLNYTPTDGRQGLYVKELCPQTKNK